MEAIDATRSLSFVVSIHFINILKQTEQLERTTSCKYCSKRCFVTPKCSELLRLSRPMNYITSIA